MKQFTGWKAERNDRQCTGHSGNSIWRQRRLQYIRRNRKRLYEELQTSDRLNEHLDEVDRRIVSASENWTMDRMPVVDRSLLRLAACEMCYVDDVPVSVSINEAVNLAKEFGGENSPRFVNGILGRIAIQLEEEQA